MTKLNNILSSNSECTACKSSKKRLLEDYGENTIKGFVKKFEEEADDLGIETTEQELRNYIKAFDRLKAKLPNDQKDLGQWSLPRLIKFVTTGKSKEGEEGVEITPDVVYHNDDNSIVIFNGNTDKNCVTYGKGEKWCIASRSWAAHRYDEAKGHPTFYLARNTNLPDNDDLSFIVIAVRNPNRFGDKNYVLHPRSNSPHYPEPITYNELLNQAPWLKDVPNLKSVIKYQPLSTQEKIGQKYEGSPTTYREWMKFPYKAKEQYLITRKNARNSYRDTKIFSDISDEEFVEKYLNKYPDVLEFVVRTAGVIDPKVLLKNLQNFSDSARKSVTNNLHTSIEPNQLSSNYIPFDVKKLLVKLNKWKLGPNERVYVTQDGETIVLLKLGEDFKMGLYQEDDEFPNVKINKRTSKFLLDYPELDKIPLSNLIDLADKGGVDAEVIRRVIDNAKEDPTSGILTKKVGDEEVVLDSSLLTSYIIKGNNITKVPFEDERVQAVFNDTRDDTEFSKNVLKNAFLDPVQGIPVSIDFDALVSVVNALPYQDRVVLVQDRGNGDLQQGIAIPGRDYRGQPLIALMEPNPTQGSDFIKPIAAYTKGENERYGHLRATGLRSLYPDQLDSYFEYLRERGITLNDDAIEGVLNITSVYIREKLLFLQKDPPLDPNNILKPVIDPDDNSIYLLDSLNRRNSKKVSSSSERLINAPLSQQRFDQLLGTIQEPEQPAQQEPTQAPQQQPTQTPTGNISVAEVMAQLGAGNEFTRIPTSDFRRLNVSNARPVSIAASNGARKRNSSLGNAGQVEQVLAVPGPQGESGIYVIRLRNGSRVISIRVQGPNNNYLLIPGETALALNSSNQLMTALRQRNLAEIRQYLVKSYLDENPDQLEEVKGILRKHINEKNEQEAA